MPKDEKPAGPLGGWLGTIGVGFGIYAGVYVMAALNLDNGAGLMAVIVCAIIGGYIGLALEHLVAILVLIAIAVLFFMARHAMWQAFTDAFL